MHSVGKLSVVGILGCLLAARTVHPAAGEEPAPTPPTAPASTAQVLEFGRFGTFSVFPPPGAVSTPSTVAVLLSASPVGSVAETLTAALQAAGALVMVIDSSRYEKVIADHGGCVYSAADFEALSHAVEQRLNLTDYIPPVLVADSAASTLTYATLAQAPPGTFEGAITLGFCRELELAKPLCPGDALRREPDPQNHGFLLRPSEIAAPWVVIDGEPGPVCAVEGFRGFVDKIPTAQVLAAPEAGSSAAPDLTTRIQKALGMVLERRRAEKAAEAERSSEIRGLPVIEMAAPDGGSRRTLVIAVSGDGGWVGYERKISERLHAQEGFPIVGLNSLRYFWHPRTPDGSAADLARILQHYLSAWGLDDAIVLGYSQGADVVPFMVARLPKSLRARVRLVVLVGSDGRAAFDTNLSSYMSGKPAVTDLWVAPEVERLGANRVLCVSGTKERHSLCTTLRSKRVTHLELATGHVFNHELGEVVAGILKTTGLEPAPPKPETAAPAAAAAPAPPP